MSALLCLGTLQQGVIVVVDERSCYVMNKMGCFPAGGCCGSTYVPTITNGDVVNTSEVFTSLLV